MSRLLRIVMPALVAGAWLGLAGPASAVFPPPVKDDGKFFSKEALDKANKKIREIYEKYRKDVVVETITSLTPEQEKKLKEADNEAKFFNRQAVDRERELGINGVYIHISRKPRYLRVHMDPLTQKTTFKAANRDEVYKVIASQFRDGEFDKGLLDGLDAIEAAFKANAAPAPGLKKSSN
jgi:uncharacterized membrane protein YgcG